MQRNICFETVNRFPRTYRWTLRTILNESRAASFPDRVQENADGWSDTWYISCEEHLSAVSCPDPGASQDCCIATEQGMYCLIIKLFWTKELIWGLRSQVSLTTNFHNCSAAAASPCESCTNNSQLVGETAMHDRDYWFLSALYFMKEESISVGYKIFT